MMLRLYADLRYDKRRRMSVLLVRDFADVKAETKQMRPNTQSNIAPPCALAPAEQRDPA